MNNSVKQKKLEAAQCEEAIMFVVCYVWGCVYEPAGADSMWTEFTISTVQKQADGEFSKRERAVSSERLKKALSIGRCAWGQTVSTVSVRVSVCGQWWSGLDRYANKRSKARRCVSHLNRNRCSASRCRLCVCSPGMCAARPEPTGSKTTAHTPAESSYTQSTSTRRGTCRFHYSYGSTPLTINSSTALTISGCWQWEGAGTIRATSYEDRHTWRLWSTRTRLSGRPPASSPSACSQDKKRSPARSRASTAPVARRRPRPQEQASSPSSLVHLLRTEVRSATHAVKSTRTQRDVDESSRALNTKHRTRMWRAPRLYIGCVHATHDESYNAE